MRKKAIIVSFSGQMWYDKEKLPRTVVGGRISFLPMQRIPVVDSNRQYTARHLLPLP